MPNLPVDDDTEDLIEAFALRLEEADVVFGHGTDNARDEAWRLVTGVLRGRRLTRALAGDLEALLRRRIEDRVPVPYLTGEAWFGDLRLHARPGVMIPRSPIAEVLANRVQPWLDREPGRILDLCCGSGCIGIAAAHVFHGARVDLVDDDDAAVAAARDNVRNTDPAVSSRIEVIASDLFASLGGRRYDLVLCNPPYARTAELDNAASEYLHEPRHGLDGGLDGLGVWRRVVDDIGAHLEAGGILVGEAGSLGREFDAAFPQLHAVWVDLERAEPQPGGGFGVFVSLGDRMGSGRVG
ncbi:MAG: 50S ribosomal protein L3 N(5)-glutamine methyltransferase [Gammaproteobacteria bacterium]|nr:50S ribosomal protein L3 N(5)-glutamine methyltransferase [Gammaproteobacteria bacterium]